MTPDGDARAWLAELAALEVPAGPAPEMTLPGPDLARAWVNRLHLPEPDREPVVATLPDPERTPELWRALAHCHRLLCSDLGAVRPPVAWPHAPQSLGPAGRYFYAHLYLAALPRTLDWHRGHGVPARVSWDTLADLGGKMALHRQVHGVGGLDKQNWLTRHFRGTLFRLGRLQFDRMLLRPTVFDGMPGPGTAGRPPGTPAPGDAVLDVHIPGDGPLTPDLCDASFAAARDFFPRHFPHEQHAHAVCRSWLLDGQLAEQLPATSNIIRFQRRFQLFPRLLNGDDDVLEFVFGVPPGTADLSALPQDTTLQRAVVSHLRAGRHWHRRSGWAALGTADAERRGEPPHRSRRPPPDHVPEVHEHKPVPEARYADRIRRTAPPERKCRP